MKCGTYWPQEVNSMETHGNLNVMNMDVEIEDSEDFQITTLCICDSKVSEDVDADLPVTSCRPGSGNVV